MRQVFGINATAGVADGDDEMRLRPAFAKATADRRFARNDESAAIGHGINGIEHDVQQGLFKLIRVSVNGRGIRIKIFDDLNFA